MQTQHRKDYMLNFRETHKDSLDEYHRNYRKNNMPKIMAENSKQSIRRRSEWEGFIPVQTQCQICGKDIFYNRGEVKKRIHFDHRHGGIEVIKYPSLFLASRPRNPKNEAIWKSCDFGMLCLCCNRGLPTKDRKLYVDGVNKYFNNTKELV